MGAVRVLRAEGVNIPIFMALYNAWFQQTPLGDFVLDLGLQIRGKLSYGEVSVLPGSSQEGLQGQVGFQRTPLGGFVLDALMVPHACWVKTVHFKKYSTWNFQGRRSDSKMADNLIQN
jgi:hypothetical protein